MDAIRAGLAAPGLSFAGLTGEDGEQILTAGYKDDALAGKAIRWSVKAAPPCQNRYWKSWASSSLQPAIR